MKKKLRYCLLAHIPSFRTLKVYSQLSDVNSMYILVLWFIVLSRQWV